MIKNDLKEPPFICDKCMVPMYGMEEVGFLGNPHTTKCEENMELMTLCPECTPYCYIFKQKKNEK
jgi:hypothetical protein